MVKVAKLDSVKRGSIQALRESGMSYAQIANQLEISKDTVFRWVKRAASDPSRPTSSLHIGNKHAKKTSKTTDSFLYRIVMGQPTISAREIKQLHPNVFENISIRTIQHRLHTDLGLRAYRAAEKPNLNDKMRRSRIQFCKKYKDWTPQDWSKVLYSDESLFTTFNSRRKSVRRPNKSNRYDPKYTLKTVKHSPQVMVWGCFSAFGRGSIYFLPQNTTMRGENYLQLLKDKLPLTMHLHRTSIFLHDGAPCHKAKKVSEWLRSNNIQVLDWPGNSPDLNPIENMWNIMKNKLQKCDTGSIPKLTEAIKILWVTDLSPEYCKSLSDSMPKRIQDVIKAKGYSTKY